jgi:hypothetical protein
LVSRRPIAVTLLCSAALHLSAAWTAYRWLPEPDVDESRDTDLSVSVTLFRQPAGAPQASASNALIEISAGRHARLPVPDLPLQALPALPENLNPAPVLREEFSVDMASLALRTPMQSRDRQQLQTALNLVSNNLPRWTDPSEPLVWRDGDKRYEFTLDHSEPADPMALDRAVLSVATEVDGLALRANVPVKRMAFSHFAQVVDRWDPGVNLAGDTIVGRLHSNSGLFVEARSNPLVTGLTTVAGKVKIDGRRSGIFASGLVKGAPRMPLPRTPIDTEAILQAGNSAHHFDSSARIHFREDGSYEWAALEGTAVPGQAMPVRYPWLIIGGEGVELQVEGVVRGSVLVYSPYRISVTGDLHYARDPREEISEDYLGLVSERNVEIAATELTGPGSLELFAAVFAGRQFRVRGFRNRDGGMLAIYGSVTAGSLSATEPRFRTQVEFDSRLEDLRPAWFPMTNRYVMDSADLHWIVESTAQR